MNYCDFLFFVIGLTMVLAKCGDGPVHVGPYLGLSLLEVRKSQSVSGSWI